MGAGKSTVGKKLAELRNLYFVDSDHEIESRTGVDISYIFEKEGEAGFRKREQLVVDDLTQRSGIVLATGGGVVTQDSNRRYLAARGYVVYLHASVSQQFARVERSDNRPLLDVPDKRATLEALFVARDPLYREIADLVLDTDGRNARQLAIDIQRELERNGT
jgi:shikimate kinase